MGEDVEIPKSDGGADSSTKFPVSDHTENMVDALARAKESVGEKSGLRGALVATADKLNKMSEDMVHSRPRKLKGLLARFNYPADVVYMAVIRPPHILLAKATAKFRDALSPKQAPSQK